MSWNREAAVVLNNPSSGVCEGGDSQPLPKFCRCSGAVTQRCKTNLAQIRAGVVVGNDLGNTRLWRRGVIGKDIDIDINTKLIANHSHVLLSAEPSYARHRGTWIMSGPKAALKAIAAAIKSQNFDDAVHEARNLLTADPKNYQA